MYKKHFYRAIQKHWKEEEKENQRQNQNQLQSFLTNMQKQKQIFPDILVHRHLSQDQKKTTYD